MKSLREYIVEAEENKVAIGHFNISNSEQFRAIVETAEQLSLPVVIGTSEGERDFLGVHEAVSLVRSARARGLPVFLNADHSYSFERVQEAVDAGYDAVIFDGTKLSFAENIEITKRCVAYAKSKNENILVEGEIGYIGTSSKLLEEIPEGAVVTEEMLTTQEELSEYVEKTGVDLIAPAVGNLHGMLKGGKNPAIHIERIQKLRDAGEVPLVLHGGSGISDEEFVSAIDAGIAMVHINTEIRVAFREGLEKGLAEDPEDIAPYRYSRPAIEEMKTVLEQRMRLFSKL